MKQWNDSGRAGYLTDHLLSGDAVRQTVTASVVSLSVTVVDDLIIAHVAARAVVGIAGVRLPQGFSAKDSRRARIQAHFLGRSEYCSP